MMFLGLLCLIAFVAAAVCEAIVVTCDHRRFSLKDSLRAASFWRRVAFLEIGALLMQTVLFWDVAAVLHMTAFRFACGLAVLLLLFGMAVLFGLGHRSHKWGTMAVCFLLLTVLLECVFKFRSFQTAEFEPIDLMGYMTSYEGASVEVKDANAPEGFVLREVAPNEPGRYILSNKKLVLEFSDLDVELDNLQFDLYAPGKDGNGENVKVTLQVTDEGNQLY